MTYRVTIPELLSFVVCGFFLGATAALLGGAVVTGHHVAALVAVAIGVCLSLVVDVLGQRIFDRAFDESLGEEPWDGQLDQQTADESLGD